jgi:hypothetical protein
MHPLLSSSLLVLRVLRCGTVELNDGGKAIDTSPRSPLPFRGIVPVERYGCAVEDAASYSSILTNVMPGLVFRDSVRDLQQLRGATIK